MSAVSGAKGVLIVGAGERVRDAVLPALSRAPGEFALRGIFSRSRRRIESAGTERAVEPLEALTRERLSEAELVYLAVAKPAVPAALARLASLEPEGTELLLETPGLLYKHLGSAGLLRRFCKVSVAEDCVELPCLDPLRALAASGEIGAPRSAVLLQCGYAYHGLALLRTLLGAPRVRAARRVRLERGYAYRELRYSGGARGLVLEPRDYSVGRLLLVGARGSVSDHSSASDGRLLLEPILESGACQGFRAGAHAALLDADERALMGAPRAGGGVFAWMDGMKRVGLLRLLRRIHAGAGAYPLAHALDDMAVDYHLEKLGRYLVNPFTSARSPLPALLLRAARPLLER